MWSLIVQPSLFQLQQQTIIPAGAVFAQNIPGNVDENGWEFQLEMLVWWDNSEGKIIYVVRAWDTLSDIAKNFWLTTRALRESNNMSISNANTLIKGQKLEIDFDQEQIIYEVNQSSSVADFADEYDLEIDDLMTLNYFGSPQEMMEPGQQLFLDLTREEAEVKDLRQQPVYTKPEWLIEELPLEMMDMADDEPSQPIVVDDLVIDVSETIDILKPDTTVTRTEIEELIDIPEPQQRIISAEETTNQLEQQKIDLEKAIQEEQNQIEKDRLEAEKKVLEEKLAAEAEIIKKAEEQKLAAIQQQVITAEQTTEKLETPPAPEPEVEQVVIKAEETTQQIKQLVECWSNKCLHNDKCRSFPANASCAPEDGDNAWVCNDWYVDTNRSCVDQATYDAQTATRGTEPVKSSTSSQYYFNPYNDGYANGRAGWHCTHYAWRYRWKHYGIMTNWRWNWWQRYRNASAAWRQTGQTPEVWAIFVWSSGSGVRSSYGHVGVVTAVDRASNSIKVSDMNYAGRYIVTERWMPINGKWMIGYVYPRKK